MEVGEALVDVLEEVGVELVELLELRVRRYVSASALAKL